MSYDNRKWLFFNRKLEKMFIYDLIEIEEARSPGMAEQGGKKYSYEFAMSYEVLMNECEAFYQ